MSGLVSGLQNRVRRFESARNLKETSETTYNKAFRRFFFFGGAEIGAEFLLKETLHIDVSRLSLKTWGN